MTECRSSLRRHEAPRSEPHAIAGFSLIELLVVVAIIAIVAGIAIPAVLQARMRANEGAAIASLAVIRSAQTTFATGCGNGGFAQSLEDLAKPPNGSTQAFIAEPLGYNGVIRSGYIANVTADAGSMIMMPAADTCNGSTNPSVSGYFAERHAETISLTGQRSFAMATSGTIYTRDDGVTIAIGMAGAITLR